MAMRYGEMLRLKVLPVQYTIHGKLEAQGT